MNNVPDFASKWMQYNRRYFGSRKIKDLLIPKSHDAGTYKVVATTKLCGQYNVQTQTMGIYEQLRLGIRHFDIRPAAYTPGDPEPWDWGTCHWSSTAVGVQGGIGASMREVIEDVNRFTENHSELIILDVSHVSNLNLRRNDLLSVSGESYPLKSEHWHQLFELLSGIKHLARLTSMNRGPDLGVNDCTLDDFIGNGQPAVVVLIDVNEYIDRDIIKQKGFWPSDHYKPPGRFDMKAMQDNEQAVRARLGDVTNSVLYLSDVVEKKRSWWMPQEMAAQGMRGTLELDGIQTPNVLTMCLAANMWLSWEVQLYPHDLVVVYGGRVYEDQRLFDMVREKIQSGTNWTPTNSVFGDDPWPAMPKSCVVMCKSNGESFVKARFAFEGQTMDFSLELRNMRLGGEDIHNPAVYAYLIAAFDRGEPTTSEGIAGILGKGRLREHNFTVERRAKGGSEWEKLTYNTTDA